MSNLVYFPFKGKMGNFDIPEDEDYRSVKLLSHEAKNPKSRILFIFDHIPTEDLMSRKLLSGAAGDLFFNLLDVAHEVYGAPDHEELDWAAVNFNAFKTYGKDANFRDDAKEAFTRRVEKFIVDYKPDVVVTLGDDPLVKLAPKKIEFCHNNKQNLYGTAFTNKATVGKKTHKFKHVPCLSLRLMCEGKGGDAPYLLGYVARCLSTGLHGKMKYKIPKLDYKPILVDTVEGVKKLLKRMAKKKVVSIDTETTGLEKATNKILTFQICADMKKAYVVPIYHKDTPFTTKELKKIILLFRDYFETQNNNDCQIYTNAKFDLNVMRFAFGVRHFKAQVWDILAGDFALDENMKILTTLMGGGYYNLGNLAMQYGCNAFYENSFGKEQRHTIKDVTLDKNVIAYCCLDVIVPFYIRRLQIRRALDTNYDMFPSMVQNTIGDQIHTFSVLESTGALADINYLFKLKLPNSAINQTIADLEEKFYKSKGVIKCDAFLKKGMDIPTQGLFGNVEERIFDLSKGEHKQTLFFDILKLKPMNHGKKLRKNGKREGKIDKAFQSKYEDVEEIKLFTNLSKAYKLRNAYVNSLIKLWGTDADFQSDTRIRPNYSYSKVVTGRTSASNPNLQQVPSRSELGKHIKRLFIAGKGKMLIKVDYSAHEVRGWSIISGDKDVAKVFDIGTGLREQYKLFPDEYIAHRIDVEGDVHKINAAYFFGVDISEVDKQLRDSVKAVIFGLIYQQGDNGLAKNTGNTVEGIRKLKKQFLKRFPVGVKWFDVAKELAKEGFFMESPLGRRRNLWALLLPDSIENADGVKAKCLRQSVNSPVQGFGSDIMMMGIRRLDSFKFQHYLKTGHYPDMNLCVSVHDSVTVEAAYEDYWLAIKFIDEGLTTAVTDMVTKQSGFKFISIPEVDYEIGANERDVKGWDFSYKQMEGHLRKGLIFQRDELGHKIDVEAIVKDIMVTQYKDMPPWMQKQLWNTKQKIKGMKKDPRTKDELKLALKWRKDVNPNRKVLRTALKELRDKIKTQSKGAKRDKAITDVNERINRLSKDIKGKKAA